MCGVFGIRSEERDVSRLAYFGLFALQHRGQEAAGIAVSDNGHLTVLREMGLVAHAFDEQQLQALPGEVAIGHTRYSTTGANKWANAQPLIHHGSSAHRRARAQRQSRERRGAASRAGRGPRQARDRARLGDHRRAHRARRGAARRSRRRRHVAPRGRLFGDGSRGRHPGRLPRPVRVSDRSRSARSETTGWSRPRPARSTSSAPTWCAMFDRAR